jgi:hypothetical protein
MLYKLAVYKNLTNGVIALATGRTPKGPSGNRAGAPRTPPRKKGRQISFFLRSLHSDSRRKLRGYRERCWRWYGKSRGYRERCRGRCGDRCGRRSWKGRRSRQKPNPPKGMSFPRRWDQRASPFLRRGRFPATRESRDSRIVSESGPSSTTRRTPNSTKHRSSKNRPGSARFHPRSKAQFRRPNVPPNALHGIPIVPSPTVRPAPCMTPGSATQTPKPSAPKPFPSRPFVHR